MERLDRVAAKQTVRLTHYGRKSGKPHEVTIWFVVDGERVYLGTANVGRQWVRNVQKTPKVKLTIRDESFDGAALDLLLHRRNAGVSHSTDCRSVLPILRVSSCSSVSFSQTCRRRSSLMTTPLPSGVNFVS